VIFLYAERQKRMKRINCCSADNTVDILLLRSLRERYRL